MNFHGQGVAARFIELQAVEEPEAGVGGLILRAGVGDAKDGRIMEAVASGDFWPGLQVEYSRASGGSAARAMDEREHAHAMWIVNRKADAVIRESMWTSGGYATA